MANNIEIGGKYRDTQSGLVGTVTGQRTPQPRDPVTTADGTPARVVAVHPADPTKVAIIDADDAIAVVAIADLPFSNRWELTGTGPKGAVERRNLPADRLEKVT